MLAEHPELKEVCLAMSELMAEKLQANLARYRTSSPQERYVDLAKRRPDLLQRIPQYQIASYLGVKPESLSRIRRRPHGHPRPDDPRLRGLSPCQLRKAPG
jgi:CRP-like cAMP-binding protein